MLVSTNKRYLFCIEGRDDFLLENKPSDVEVVYWSSDSGYALDALRQMGKSLRALPELKYWDNTQWKTVDICREVDYINWFNITKLQENSNMQWYIFDTVEDAETAQNAIFAEAVSNKHASLPSPGSTRYAVPKLHPSNGKAAIPVGAGGVPTESYRASEAVTLPEPVTLDNTWDAEPTSPCAFIDAEGNVVQVSYVDMTLETVQETFPEATTKISNPPDNLVPIQSLAAYVSSKHLLESKVSVLRSSSSGVPNFDRVRPLILKYHKKTSGDGSDISHYELAEDLRLYKDWKYLWTDFVDEEIISWGYEFTKEDGKRVFSLSRNAQINLVAFASILDWAEYDALTGGDPPTLSYKHDIYGSYTFASKSEFRIAALSAFGLVSAILESGNTIKASIRDATTKSALDAIVDNRLETWPKPQHTVSE